MTYKKCRVMLDNRRFCRLYNSLQPRQRSHSHPVTIGTRVVQFRFKGFIVVDMGWIEYSTSFKVF